MKKETATKGLKALLVMLIACFAFVALTGFSAKAATLGYEHFGLAYYSDSSVSIKFNTGDVSYGGRNYHINGRVQILDLNMNVLAEKEAYGYASIPFASAQNAVYYYRVIPFIEVKGQKTDVGEPSPVKAYSTIVLKDKTSKKDRKLRVRCPNVPGVTSVRIMISRTKNGSYAPVGKPLKPGKLSKKMRKLGLNKFFYFYPQPTLASGVPCENVKVNEVYFYRIWRRR